MNAEQLKSRSIQRVAGPDSVRALAALSVMLAHIVSPQLEALLQYTLFASTVVQSYSKYFITGIPVITFFVVSGFCIHYPYLQRPLPVFSFLAARWTRLLIPASVACLIAILGRLKHFNPWDGFILWSIVCELFYYTLYPLFLWLSRRISFVRQYLIAVVLALSFVSILGSDEYGNMHIYGPWLNWLVGLPCWLLGCVLAEYVSSRKHTTKSTTPVFLWRLVVTIAAPVLLWLSLNTRLGLHLTLHIFALLSFFWILAEIRAPRNSKTLLESVGQWSYSIYLLHMPIYAIFGRILTRLVDNPVYYQLASVPIILWLCYYFYRFVEAPSHQYARKLYLRIPAYLWVDGQRNITKPPSP